MPSRTPSGIWSTASARLQTAFIAFLCASALLWTNARAADDIELFRAREDQGYFVRASGKALFNVGVSVETVRPVYGAGEYGNGYVLPDIGGTDRTWNWGYNSPGQVDTANDQLQLERYENLPPLATQDESAIAPGGEVMVGAEIATFPLGKQTVRFGFEVGYGFNFLSVDTASLGSSMVTYTTAAYDLNGVRGANDPPYTGTFQGPGPLIGVNPASTNSVTSMSTASTSGQLDTTLHNVKLGFWFDYPINGSLFTSLSVGYASIYADSQFKYTETFTYPDVTASTTVGGRDEWNPGFYTQWRLGYHALRRVDVFLGVDYQWNGKMTFSGADQNVTLDFTAMFGALAGIQVNF